MNSTLNRALSDPEMSICLSDENESPLNAVSERPRKPVQASPHQYEVFKMEMRQLITTLVSSQREEMRQLNLTMKEIKDTNKNIEASLTYLTSQNEELKQKINTLEERTRQDREYIIFLEDKLDDMQLASRKSNFEIKGVPRTESETKQDLLEMVVTLSETIDCKINKSDIKDIYRVRSKKPDQKSTPIVVETGSVLLKTDILKMIAHAIECEGTDLDGRLRINKNDFTIMSQNIVSIYKNFHDFILTLSTLSFETDMITFTECRLNQNKPLPQLNNYEVYYTTRQLNQNDGVVAYKKKTLKHKVKEVTLQQASCLQVDVLNNTVLCIYRSPSYPNAENFVNSLDSHLEPLPSHSSIIIAGDININIRPQTTERPQEYKNRMNYLDMLANYGILPGHTLPTREQSCLDHFMLKINKSKCKASIAVMQTTTSDHSTTLLSISKIKKQLKDNKIKQTVNFENALKYLQTKNLPELLFCGDPLAVINNLIDKIIESLKLNTSVSTIPCSKRIIQPWISAGILRCIRNRNKLQKNLRNDPHNDILRITYRRYRNYCNNLIKRMKRQYDRENIIKSLNNNKLLWKNIKNITYSNKSRNTNTELLNLKSSPAESANFINNYFANIGMHLASKIQNVYETPISRHEDNNPVPLHSFVLLHTDIDEVKDVILSLKSNSAPGWDNIPNDFIKMAVNDLAPIISYLTNLCFDTGIFPAPLKHSIITPVYKGGDRDDISNYRPISVLPAISKILEKLLNIRLLNYLNKFDILAPAQKHSIPSLSLSLCTNLKKLE
ncbi:hypothetical protein ABMA28_014029 [Loxostege sticticalis]|uniref:Reverse transcriptase domain-containing protein n=1 Tax=Loxostege sticticalis TaxID=481309 RepID=A0ABD0TFA1_LOXSC